MGKKMKLKLKDLEVQSFITTEHTEDQEIIGGNTVTPGDVGDCCALASVMQNGGAKFCCDATYTNYCAVQNKTPNDSCVNTIHNPECSSRACPGSGRANPTGCGCGNTIPPCAGMTCDDC